MDITEDKIINQSFELRHSIRPYIGLPLIIILLSPLFIWGAVKSKDWSFFGIVCIGLCLFIADDIRQGMRYQVWWKDGSVIRRTSNGYTTKIEGSEITHIANEVSNLQTAAKLSRPFRRITIYGKTSEGEVHLDVSLKHFKIEDVRKLMDLIQQKRPDLKIPSVLQ